MCTQHLEGVAFGNVPGEFGGSSDDEEPVRRSEVDGSLNILHSTGLPAARRTTTTTPQL